MKIGDKVSVLDDDLRGKIITITRDAVTIEDEHGFCHHFSSDKIVPIDSELYKKFTVNTKPEPRKIISKKKAANVLVLDLHIEKLTAKSRNLDSFERLFMQKQKLTETLDFCRRSGIKHLEIIHGVGDGILQKMVYDVLQSQGGLDFRDREILHHQSGSVRVDLL